MSRILTVKNLCEQTGYKCDHILKFIHTGELRAINLAAADAKRKRWGIDEHDWQQFLAKRATREPDSYVVETPKTRTPKSPRSFV